MNLANRLHAVIEETGIDQVELARVMGVTKGAVNQLLKGDIQSLKLEYAVGVQDTFGYNAVWLVLGKGPKKGAGSVEEAVESANRGQNRPLSDIAREAILCVVRLDAFDEKARDLLRHHVSLMGFAEHSFSMQYSSHGYNVEEVERLLGARVIETGSMNERRGRAKSG